jgi:SAM-dependent methyltransferase
MSLRKHTFIRLRDHLFGGRKTRRKETKTARKSDAFSSDEWQRDDMGFAHRGYETYDAYLKHQASKLDAAYERRVEKDAAEVALFRAAFEEIPELSRARDVLCLGARLGAEVRALRDLHHFAVGIDLNPGKDNSYVHYGDFHAIPFGDGTVDAVYTNALDHVFDLERVMKEVHRVLRTGGIFVADIIPGYDEGQLPGRYEATFWRSRNELLDRILASGPFYSISLRDLPARDRNHWLQAVMRKIESSRTEVPSPPLAAATVD